MSLAFENRDCIVLMDDPLARRAARDVGLQCWGTIRILLEAKGHGLTGEITTYVDRLASSSLLLSKENRRRILALAGEDHPEPSEEEEEAEGALEIETTPEAETTAAEGTPPIPAEGPAAQKTDVVADVPKDNGAQITPSPEEIENPEN